MSVSDQHVILLRERGLEERSRGVSARDDHADIKICEMTDMTWKLDKLKNCFWSKNITLMEQENPQRVHYLLNVLRSFDKKHKG